MLEVGAPQQVGTPPTENPGSATVHVNVKSCSNSIVASKCKNILLIELTTAILSDQSIMTLPLMVGPKTLKAIVIANSSNS